MTEAWGIAIVNGSEVAHIHHGQAGLTGYRFADIRVPTTHPSELPSAADFAKVRAHMEPDAYVMVTPTVFAALLSALDKASGPTCPKCGAVGASDGFIRHKPDCAGVDCE